MTLHLQPITRRLITRLLAIIPSAVVAVAVGRKGIDALLVASQVVLSVVLPFITFPLLWCTSSKAIMSVKKVKNVTGTGHDTSTSKGWKGATEATIEDASSSPAPGSPSLPALVKSPGPDAVLTNSTLERGESNEEWVDYSNNKLTIGVGAAIWLLVVAANVYVLIDLARGGATH